MKFEPNSQLNKYILRKSKIGIKNKWTYKYNTMNIWSLKNMYLPTPLHKQDVTQGQFLSIV